MSNTDKRTNIITFLLVVIALISIYSVSRNLQFALILIIIMLVVILGISWYIQNELKQIFKKN